MTLEAQLHDGRILEFPDGTDPAVIQATVKNVLAGESTISGEIGRGLLRGASNLSMMMPKAAGTLILGPIGGEVISRGIEALAAPSREFVKAAPKDETQKFAGTAAEVVGGSIAGGGVGTIRGGIMTGTTALGGAAGQQIGGDWGQFLGSIAGAYGGATAMTIARKTGQILADVWATVGASFGSKTGIERLASKAVTEKIGGDAKRILEALKSPTQYVPGAKVTVGEAIAEAQMGKPEQFGGAVTRLQKDLSGAKGVEDILPSVTKQQAAAVERHLKNLDKITSPMRERSLDAANQVGGIKAAPLIKNIETMMEEPGQRASTVVTKTLTDIKEKLISLIETGGQIDARDLYTVRKEIGNTIRTHAKETANWDKRLTSGLEREIQKHIDNAIEGAGGIGWKNYLDVYSRGKQAVTNYESRIEQMQEIQKSVKGQPAAIVQGELPQPPTLLHRGMMVVNYALKLVAEDANDPVVKRIATSMQDPAEFAKLIKLPIAHKDRAAINYVLNSLVSSKLDEAGKNLLEEAQ